MNEFLKQAGPDLKGMIPYLLSGGAGALAGGALTAASPERPDETSAQRRNRILRNAAMMGAGTAAGHAGIAYGYPKFTAPIPKGEPSQLESVADGLKTNPLYYLGGAAGAGVAVKGMARGEEVRNINSLIDRMHANGNGSTVKHVNPKTSNPASFIRNLLGDHLTPGAGKQVAEFKGQPDGFFRDMGVNRPGMERTVAKTNFPDVFQNPKMPGLGDAAEGGLGKRLLNYPGKLQNWAMHQSGNGARSAIDGAAIKGEGKLLADRALGLGDRSGGKMKRLALLTAILGLPQLTSSLAQHSNPDAFQQ